MSAIAVIKKSSILDLAANLFVRTTSATVAEDVTSSGSPGDLTPAGFNPLGIAKWVDKSSGISIGYPSLTLSVRPPSKTSRLTRVVAKWSQPILEATSGITGTGFQPAPTVAYTLVANLEFLLPERSTLAERTAFLSVLISLLSRKVNASDDAPSTVTGTPIIDAVLSYEPPY
jgi:hypothetical protein